MQNRIISARSPCTHTSRRAKQSERPASTSQLSLACSPPVPRTRCSPEAILLPVGSRHVHWHVVGLKLHSLQTPDMVCTPTKSGARLLPVPAARWCSITVTKAEFPSWVGLGGGREGWRGGCVVESHPHLRPPLCPVHPQCQCFLFNYAPFPSFSSPPAAPAKGALVTRSFARSLACSLASSLAGGGRSRRAEPAVCPGRPEPGMDELLAG